MHIFRLYRTSTHSFKMIGGKLEEELSPQGIYYVYNTNRTWKKLSRKKQKKLIKNKGTITPKPHAHLQTMSLPGIIVLQELSLRLSIFHFR